MVNSDKSDKSLSRRHSLPFLSEWDVIQTEPQVYVPSRPGSTSPTMPPQPILHATRLPSIALPARSSWRLSFSGDDRGNTLRKLSQGHAIPVTLDTDLLRSKSPTPTRGLHSPGLRLSSQVILSSDETSNLDSLASHSKMCSADQAFGGVDGSSTIHLHEMGISQRLTSKGLRGSSSSPQLSSSDSGYGHTSDLGGSAQIHTERSRLMRKATDSAALSERIPQSWGQVIPSQGSSIYLSVDNSPQESRQSSRFNLLSLLSGSKNKISAAEYQG